ncbi:MAG TPA: NAD(P)-binding domain-containing protein [Thermomonospora sp.]|nr:NAD(P)-binding domain-containing protein [Thermomonospora sp.]
MATDVTVMGLGPMGQALAGAFLAAGHSTTVWNRTASKADALVAKGAVRAATPQEAAAASPLTILCVLDYDAAHAIVEPAADALKGRTLINLTADTPERAQRMALWASGNGIDYLDGAIMTPTESIGGTDAVLLYSGPEDVYQAHRATLAALGGSQTHLGEDPARAAAHDVALLDMFWTAVSGIAHGFALAGANGVKGTDLAPFAKDIIALLQVMVPLCVEYAESDVHPGDDSNLVSMATGVGHVIQAAEAKGMDASVQRAAKALMDRAIEAGHGSDGITRLIPVVRGR